MKHTELLAILTLVSARDFIQVRPALTAALGGDANISHLLTLIHYKTEPGFRHVHERDGFHWWTASLPDLVEATGMTVDRIRRALKVLIEMGLIVAEKHYLDGGYDQRLSYRVADPEDFDSSKTVENTDLGSSPDGSGLEPRSTWVGAQIELGPSPDVSSVKTYRHRHNADGDEPVDKSGPFQLTPKREKLVTDAMVAAGQAHNIQAFLQHLEMQTWGTAEREIQTWCGIAEAMRHGEHNRREDVNELLASAAIATVSDEEWHRLLRSHAHGVLGHGPHCTYDEHSGYCNEHGLRSPEEEP